MTTARLILTALALCAFILAFVRFLLETLSAFILGAHAMGGIMAVMTIGLGIGCWSLRRELTRELADE